jgi:bisphosphoglycerate-independent phosphoglycerate mutase (AlkP superfamily)
MLIANEFRFKASKDKNYMSLSAKVPDGVVSDIAPTILDLFGLPKPQEMTGVNLLEMLEQEGQIGSA